MNIWAKNEWPRVIKAWMYGIAELCGRSCCLNELWYQRNEADKRNLSLSKSALLCLGQLQAVSLSHLLVQLLVAGVKQVWQRYGCVWSAAKGWWCLLGAAVQDGAGSARVCFDSSSVKDSLLPPCQGLPCTREFSGLHTRSLQRPCWLETVRTNCTNLLGGIQYLQGKCQPGEQHELFGCYRTSSSMPIWVRSACVSQWNKIIIVTNRVYQF